MWLGYPARLPMYDFRKPLPADGKVPVDAGDPIDDPNWPNMEGGNFPACSGPTTWSGSPRTCRRARAWCRTSSPAPGHAELSATTLPPCGVELDQYGFPKGGRPTSSFPSPPPPRSAAQRPGRQPAACRCRMAMATAPVQGGNGSGDSGRGRPPHRWWSGGRPTTTDRPTGRPPPSIPGRPSTVTRPVVTDDPGPTTTGRGRSTTTFSGPHRQPAHDHRARQRPTTSTDQGAGPSPVVPGVRSTGFGGPRRRPSLSHPLRMVVS